jgi:hypothetical protein
MTFSHKVSTQSDLCLFWLAPHTYCGAATLGAPTPGLAAEGIVGMWWIPGACVGANSFSTSVVHRRVGVALDGHDLGPLLPHLQILVEPANLLTPVQMLLSSREAMYTASTVQMNGKAVALCSGRQLPPANMLYCGEPSLPGPGDVTGPSSSSVVVGMTAEDWRRGELRTGLNIAVDLACGLIPSVGNEIRAPIADEIADSAIGEAGERVGDAGSQGIELLFSDDPGEVELSLPGVGGVVVSRDADGSYSVRGHPPYELTNPFEGHPPPMGPFNTGLPIPLIDVGGRYEPL